MRKPKRYQPTEEMQNLPIGTAVIVTRDDGREDRTTTRSLPWELGGHTWVVQLTGEAGCYALERVRKETP